MPICSKIKKKWCKWNVSKSYKWKCILLLSQISYTFLLRYFSQLEITMSSMCRQKLEREFYMCCCWYVCTKQWSTEHWEINSFIRIKSVSIFLYIWIQIIALCILQHCLLFPSKIISNFFSSDSSQNRSLCNLLEREYIFLIFLKIEHSIG